MSDALSPERVDLSIVVLCLNTRELVVPCLESIDRNAPEGPYEVILIDNGSHDGTEELVRMRFPDVRVIRNTTNLGFPKAINQGLRACRGDHALLLNDDTVVLPGALAQMVDFMHGHPEVGIVGCRHVGTDGETQPAAGGLPGFWTQFASFYGLKRLVPRKTAMRFVNGASQRLPLLRRLTPGYFIPFEASQQPRQVGFISGACLLARRQMWEEIGLLDEEIFMYMEDVDWCRRAGDAGWHIYYLPSATIIHLRGQSTMKVSEGRTYQMSANRVRSLIYYSRKHRGLFGAVAAKAIVIPAITGRLLLTSVRRLMPGADKRVLTSDVAHLRDVLRVSLKA